jgi:hypothetical protein
MESPNALIWVPASSYDAVRPMWDEQYVWCPLPVDTSLPLQQTSFIKLDDAPASRTRANTARSRAGLGDSIAVPVRIPEHATSGAGGAATTTTLPVSAAAVKGAATRRHRGLDTTCGNVFGETKRAPTARGSRSKRKQGTAQMLPTLSQLSQPQSRGSEPPSGPEGRSIKRRNVTSQISNMNSSRKAQSPTLTNSKSGEKGLIVRMKLNLDVEVQVRASLRGDLTLALL